MKYFLVIIAFFLFTNSTTLDSSEVYATMELNNSVVKEDVPYKKKIKVFDSYVDSFFDCLSSSTLSLEVFKKGLVGYYDLLFQNKLTNRKYLTIVDYSLPSNKKRFFVIDMDSKKIVYNSLVAHGKKSGQLTATKFSNESNSKMSSLGFYLTGKIYNGKYDYSMKLHGLEYSNNKAFDRGVVAHSAEYATQAFMKKNGNVLGRSFGCTALPFKNYKKIVDTIKNGSCLFVFANKKRYLNKSKFLNSKNFIEAFYSAYLQ